MKNLKPGDIIEFYDSPTDGEVRKSCTYVDVIHSVDFCQPGNRVNYFMKMYGEVTGRMTVPSTSVIRVVEEGKPFKIKMRTPKYNIGQKVIYDDSRKGECVMLIGEIEISSSSLQREDAGDIYYGDGKVKSFIVESDVTGVVQP